MRYQVEARSSQGVTSGPSAMFKVGPRVHLALLWHQHQPVYKNTRSASPRGSYTQPWVRMHALRDYVGMPLLVAERPSVHVTFNLTPCLLSQLDDLTEGGASDRLQELLLRDPAGLGSEERAEVLARAFDADPIHQIAANPRYAELFAPRFSTHAASVRPSSRLPVARSTRHATVTDCPLSTGHVPMRSTTGSPGLGR